MPKKSLPMAGGCGCNDEEAAICGCRDAAEAKGLEMLRKMTASKEDEQVAEKSGAGHQKAGKS